jgi:hypothetical protein
LTKTIQETNDRLDGVRISIEELISWAESDADYFDECGAPDFAVQDRRRARDLRLALQVLQPCWRGASIW